MENNGLFAKMEQAIINYEKDEAVRLARICLEKGLKPTDAISNGFLKGMQSVGELFEREEIFLPELFAAAEAMAAATEVLREAIRKSGEGVKYLGKGIAGTVQGDIHDIGIKLVTTLLGANGFDIEFLGIDIPTHVFVDKAKEAKPDIILLSALLTTTMPGQKEVIDSLKEAGIRGNVKVMVGGAPVSQDWADEIGADGYGKHAGAAVEVAKKLMGV